MKDDPFVAEIRRRREAHAAQFQYDLDAIFRDIKAREQASGKTYVTLAPRRLKPATPEPRSKRPGR